MEDKEPKKVMTLREAAKYLHVSPSHLSNVLNGKVHGVPQIRSARVGLRSVRFRREWLDEWLDSTAKKVAL